MAVDPLEIKDRKLFGKIAVKNGLLTKEQFLTAVRIMDSHDGKKTLGEVMMEENLLNLREIQRVKRAQERLRDKRTGGARPKTAKERVRRLTAQIARVFSPDDLDVDDLESIETTALRASDVGLRPVSAEPTASVSGHHLSLIQKAIEMGASDVHFQSGSAPFVRKDGRLIPLDDRVIDAAENEANLLDMLDGDQRRTFDETMTIDLAISLPGMARLRGSYSRQIDGVDASFRIIPDQIPSLPALGLPNEISLFTTFHQGLVLVTGPAGCGKSSTMASLVNLVNVQKKLHILTVEDPIEFIYPRGRCLVHQRQAGRDTASFERALSAALREDPDIIVVGEMRDRETIGLALSAAETGHLVFGTLHTKNAVRTVDRLIDAFPPDKQNQARSMLSESLRGVISQQMVVRADGKGRVPAVEVLVVTAAIANLIRDNRTFQIRSSMQTGRKQGNRIMDESLKALVDAGTVSPQEAAKVAENPNLFAA